jgi:hypothetical protein
MPNCACLSERQAESLASWVRAGGTIIAEFETGHYDEGGRRLQDFRLAEVFGVRSRNEVSGPHHHDFLDAAELARSHEHAMETTTLPSPRFRLRVTTTTGVAAIRCYRDLTSNIPHALEPSDEPFLVTNSFGSGRSHYLAGTFGELYKTELFSWYREVVGALLADADPAPMTVAGPPHVIELMYHEQPDTGRRLLFLLNHELGPVEEVIPATELKIAFRRATPPARVRALRAGIDLTTTRREGGWSCTLPRLNEFEVLAMEPRG